MTLLCPGSPNLGDDFFEYTLLLNLGPPETLSPGCKHFIVGVFKGMTMKAKGDEVFQAVAPPTANRDTMVNVKPSLWMEPRPLPQATTPIPKLFQSIGTALNASLSISVKNGKTSPTPVRRGLGGQSVLRFSDFQPSLPGCFAPPSKSHLWVSKVGLRYSCSLEFLQLLAKFFALISAIGVEKVKNRPK